MRPSTKRIIGWFLSVTLLVTGIVLPIPTKAATTEYSSWGSWSSWQDTAVSETDLRDVETRQVYVNTTYHYFRYSNQYSGGYGSYVYSSSYPNYYTYDFTSELTKTGTAGGYNKYQWWYSSSNYVSVYGCSPYTTDNYKTQYRYRTRSLIYYYKVSYNANGGSGAPSAQTKTGGKALTLSSTVPTKKFTITYNANGGSVPSNSKSVSCTFKNWKASNGTTYSKGASYTSDADTTMTAQWTNPTAGTLETPNRTGYTFNGWYTSASGGNKITSASTISANTTLYAQWTANTYSVKYNGNGSTSGAMSDSLYTYDIEEKLASNLFDKTGYTFGGWNTKTDGSGTSFANGASVKNLSSTNGSMISLYAQWTPNTYTIKYDGNGNTSGSMTDSVFIYDVIASLEKNKYQKAHYLFNGWNTKADGSGVRYLDTEEVINLSSVEGDLIVLYAQWTINEYDVCFDSNGGISAPEQQAKVHNESLVLTTELPKKEYVVTYNLGYLPGTSSIPTIESDTQKVSSKFACWNTAKDGSGVSYLPGDLYVENMPVELYARWSGSKGTELLLPVREGYDFLNWYGVYDCIDETISDVIINQSDYYGKEADIYGDITMYAQWSAKRYPVVFDANGGTCVLASKEVTFDSTYGTLPTPTYSGRIFDGWYTSKENGVKVLENTKVDKAEATTLYAKWIDKEIVSIAVDLERTKTTYYVGDEFDKSLVALIVTCVDGEKYTIYDGFECNNPSLNKVCKKRVKVAYEGFETSYDINIVNAPLASISVKRLPNKINYNIGDEFSADGMILNVVYLNGYTEEIYDNYDIVYDFGAIGDKEVTVKYTQGDTTVYTSFFVNVSSVPTVFSNVSKAVNGQVLSVPVNIVDNSGIMGLGIEIEYDDVLVTPVSVECGEILNGAFNDSIDTEQGNIFRIYWTGSENVIEDGELFTINFMVSDNAFGDCNIKIRCLEDDTFNDAWETVKLNCNDISIDIGGGNSDTTYIFSKSALAKTGEKFDYEIEIANNTGFENMSLSISYDPNAFKPIIVTNGIAVVSNSNIDSADGKLNLNFESIKASVGDGIICTISFDVLYCDTDSYTLGLNSSINKIDCSDSIVNVSHGPAKVYANEVIVTQDLVSIPVSVIGNQGMMGFKLNFRYDSSILKPVSASAGKIITDGMSEDNIDTSREGEFSVIWVGNDDLVDDGEMIVIEFIVLEPLVNDTIIELGYSQADTYNSLWEDVTLICEDIVVKTKTQMLMGDVDGDGDITIMDVTMIQRHIAQLITISEDELICADTDKDGNITIMDATIIQRFIAQLIPSI